jgi:hypothetical protein
MSESEKVSESTLTRETILRALHNLSDELGKRGVTGELCLFGGTANEPSDVGDIIFLIRHLQIQSAAAVLELVLRYYPANQMPVKTQYLIEGLFEEGKI